MLNDQKVVNVAVVGCGVFGAEIAMKARSCGLTVKVYEAKTDILSGASANNQNRLHLGFHYPRDLETGKQSIRGFDAFRERFSDCIQGGFLNAYFIANEASFTSPQAYLEFCKLLGVPYRPISTGDFPVVVKGADTGVLCEELVYDCGILRSLIWQELRREKIDVALGARVEKITRVGDRYRLDSTSQEPVLADVVINASYADINRLTGQLGYEVSERLFEYTAVPIIKLDMPRLGVTIMDGPFMTLLPYGKSDKFLLYHVEHTLIAKEVAHQLPPSWLTPGSSPFAKVDKERYFKEMIDLCKGFVPVLEQATLAGFLEGPRMVLAHRDDSDTRPSIISCYENSYFTVFAGKIDHCMWVAEDVCQHLKDRFRL